MKTSKAYRPLLAIAFLSIAAEASANLTEYNSEATFNAQGTIAFDSFFNDFGEGFGYPSGEFNPFYTPFTRGDVTYTSEQNLTVGTATGYTTNPEVMMTDNYWTPLTATVNTAPEYSMLGFDIGINNNTPLDIDIDTNLGEVDYLDVTVPNLELSNASPAFVGFVASPGQYFTGFQIVSEGQGDLGEISNVEVGGAGPSVPDSTGTIMLLGLGAIALAGYRRMIAA
jgi:hypothetical protein